MEKVSLQQGWRFLLPGGRERIAKGQQLRLKKARERGEPHYPAETAKKKRDQAVKELAPVFLENTDVSLRELSRILFNAGHTNRKGNPIDPARIARYRNRIDELIKEGLLESPNP